jgi:hypothetical protein
LLRKKKWPLRGAAKFREETPRKGGGLAIEDRDTALQQYAEAGTCLQDESFQIQRKRSQKHWKKSTSVPLFVANAAFLIICAPQ